MLVHCSVLFLSLMSFEPTVGTVQPISESTEVERLVEQLSVDIDNRLRSLEPSRNAVIWSQGFNEIIHKYPFVDFYMIENRLRKLGSNTYLIAVPASQAPPGLRVRSLLGTPEGDMDYFLYVEVNGPEAANVDREKFEAGSLNENLEHLKVTGVLVRQSEAKP